MYTILSAKGFSKIGKRVNNEDTIYPFLEGDERTESLRLKIPHLQNLYIVCDGVGGSNKGEVASQLICTNYPIYISDAPPPINGIIPESYFQSGVEWVEKAMDLYIQNNPDSSGMASTITLLYFNEAGANIIWAGDSRVYHFRKGKQLFRTEDHSYVNELIKSGQLTAEEAEKHPQKNIILRAVQGSNSPTRIDFYFIPWAEIEPEDEFFLCTDGVTETWVPEAMIALFQDTLSQESRVEYLQQACETQSRDNYSGYLIQIGEKKIGEPIVGGSSEIPDTPIPVEEPQIMIEEKPGHLLTTTTAIHETSGKDVAPPLLTEETQNMVELEPITVPEAPENKPPLPEHNIPPAIEEKTTIIQPEKPSIKVPPIHNPEIPLVSERPNIKPPVVEEMPAPKKKNWVLWGVMIGFVLTGIFAILWYFTEGPGSTNTHFETYYKKAQAQVAEQCEKLGKCSEAKGVVNQAKSAAETMEEHRLADSLLARVMRKEDEIRKKATLNVPDPEPTDKGKSDEKAEGNPKSKTVTPKANAPVTPKTTTTSVPSNKPAATTPAKPSEKPATTTTKPVTPPVQVTPSKISSDKIKTPPPPPAPESSSNPK